MYAYIYNRTTSFRESLTLIRTQKRPSWAGLSHSSQGVLLCGASASAKVGAIPPPLPPAASALLSPSAVRVRFRLGFACMEWWMLKNTRVIFSISLENSGAKKKKKNSYTFIKKKYVAKVKSLPSYVQYQPCGGGEWALPVQAPPQSPLGLRGCDDL